MDDDAQVRKAERPCTFDVIGGLDVEHLRPREPGEDGRSRKPDGDHGVHEARSQEGRENDGDDQEGGCQERIGDARDDDVNGAPDISREHAEEGAEANRDAGRDEARREGGASSEDHPRKYVTAKLVGSKPMQGRGRFANERIVRLDRIIRHDPIGEERTEYADQRNEDAEQRGLVGHQFAEGAAAFGRGRGLDCSTVFERQRHDARSRGLRRSWAMSARRFRRMKPTPVHSATPWTTA